MDKLIWHSNAPHAGTGYAQQTSIFLPRLAEHYEVGCSCFYGVEGSIIAWNGIPLYPALGQTHGNETILDHARVHFGPDLRAGTVVTLMDVWVLSAPVWRQLNVASWVPVDHEPVPRPVAAYFRETGAVPIAMSRFGERMLTEAGLDPLYCPHAVDTKTYRPLDKAEAREATGIPADAFVIGMVAANKGNPSRKCFTEAILAFKRFHARHPEARLYLHTEATGLFDGVNLPQLIGDAGVDPDTVIFPDQYRVKHFPFDGGTMAKIYSSFDVLLAASAGEGFGVPAIEAQSCGIPVIASDFSAQPELVGAGWLVEGTKTYTPIGSWQFRPSVDDMVDALRQAYGQTREHRAKAREFALGYDVDRVFADYMLPTLDAVRKRCEDRQPVTLAA